MKAFVVEPYGADGLRAADVPAPDVGAADVLVKVSAASVNPLDKMVRDGEFKRLLKYRTPFVLGHDVAVLTYAGLRPQEALALEWRHVRERTLLVERAVSDGQLKVLKNRRQPRTVPLLAPLREDLADWRRASGSPIPSRPVFPAASGGFWRASDWRNWRKRIYRPAAESIGLSGARPYDLRHAFASLLIHEGRLSVVEIAAQLGHNPTVCLDTYAHVMAEERDGAYVSAEDQIVQARQALAAPSDADVQRR